MEPGSKQAVILLSDKTDIKLKLIRRNKNKKKNFILTKGTTNQEDITTLNKRHIRLINSIS